MTVLLEYINLIVFIYYIHVYLHVGYKVFHEGECTVPACGWLEFLANGVSNVEEKLGKGPELFGRVKCQIS